MRLKNYIYEDFDGTHFPDAYTGTVEWHAISFEHCFIHKGTRINKVHWFYDKGVSSYEEKVQGSTALIKLALLHPGVFKINCKAYIQADGEQETHVQRMIIRVY